MNIDLKGKTAIVTGGARDIGRAVALKFAECGASVVVNYNSSEEKANAVVKEITGRRGRAIAVRADVSNKADVDQLVSLTTKAFGDKIDILVNNAGGILARKKL